MKTDKLAKQLKKELTRNPKKTIALGLVTLVALWFWAPLVWKYVGGGKSKKSPAKDTAVAATETAPPQTATDTAKGPLPAPKIDWDQLLKRIESDERMISARLPKDSRDPFATTPKEQELVVAQPANQTGTAGQARTTTSTDPTPEALGLVLQGTFISARVQRATISGKTYRPGALISAAAGGQTNDNSQGTATPAKPITFQLDLIEARSVVLSRNGKQFKLSLKNPLLDEDEQLTLAPTSAQQPEAEEQP